MARRCLFRDDKSFSPPTEEEAPQSGCSGEGLQEPAPVQVTCEAAEEVKRLLDPIEPQLMSDFNICALSARNQKEPLVDIMTRNINGYLENTYEKLLSLEGLTHCGRLDPVNCQECGIDCLSHTILELHISELHDPFAAANSTQPPSYKCPVPWCSVSLPCPNVRLVHACRAHGLLANSLIFSVLKQT